MTQSQSQPTHLRRARLALACVSIAANALCGGGVFTFSLMSPALVDHLKLTQPQLTTIALAGMMGQYPFAAMIGKVVDKYGPWACSIFASCLFFTGFGLFANEIANTPDDIVLPSASSFHHLTVYFFIAGLGTAFSYFSSLFAACKNFPGFIGIASGTSITLFGLSPMFISILASRFFSHPDEGLDVTRFLRFLALFCGAVHLFGAFTLHIIPLPEDPPSAVLEDPEGSVHVDEQTALLQGKRNGAAEVETRIVAASPVKGGSAVDLAKDHYFWALAFVLFVILGSSEMVISNIGTIVLSLASQTSSAIMDPSTDVATATQVRFLSVANTLSRLVVGPLADFVSPIASHPPSDAQSIPRKRHVSRVAFLFFSILVLALTYSWMVLGVRSQVDLWALSIGAGVAYGSTFTILPSLVSSAWGIENLGRNFGILTYAPFLGTPAFSYFYAFNAASHSSDGAVCKGIECWSTTFSWYTAIAFAACGVTGYLWRSWRDQV
ncbi:MFS general substrate transporter [Suillus clintonianus]|uniref:MFS general substrate transporter n=1 Tax=Suillus clintonianus TaxID=1904413 RepID=UPI001B877395|nr:MFS general substrate transporter [Suillus clintonianus]KAG2157356.1 MFS general substrate transporter [Suillus clintonianus]